MISVTPLKLVFHLISTVILGGDRANADCPANEPINNIMAADNFFLGKKDNVFTNKPIKFQRKITSIKTLGLSTVPVLAIACGIKAL